MPANTELSLSTYLGMSIDSLVKQGNSPSKVRYLVNTLLVEEAIKLVEGDKSEPIDYYGIKPLFVGVKYIFDGELSKLQDIPEDYRFSDVDEEIKRLKFISDYLESRIKNCKEKEK